ncbi:MAG: hypothetical protein DI539_27780 [Flavobacterium psychrophilum]|nr:MAG: hypothetical protein DI539_27780 [Flavobacterium psychrophilum]
MKTIFGIAFCFFVIQSCELKSEGKNDSEFIKKLKINQNKAVSYLDSLNCVDLYVESKWKIYLKYCDKKVVMDNW